MLLIDGVKYELWARLSEDELEQIVNEHAQEIFGENSIYFDKKQRLKSASGVVSIPDGYVIVLGDAPTWHIVEVELSSHQPYEHIVPQTDKFINAVDYQNARNEIVEALYRALNDDDLLKVKTRKAIGRDKDLHYFLSSLISRPPIVTIIIEKETEQLREALKKYSQKKVVELRTFRRVGAETVHAHLFEPLYKGVDLKAISMQHVEEEFGDSFGFEVENFWIKYKRLRIFSSFLELLRLRKDTNFDLETDIGIIKTKIDKWNQICVGMGKWYKAHPKLRKGDKVRITIIEPMKKYRLEIVE
jgi:hypothetical protein